MADNSSIDSLKSLNTNRNGLAKPTQFNMVFSLPAEINTQAARDLSIMCQTSSLPTRTVTTLDYTGTQRHSYRVPTGYAYDTITFTFLVGNDFFPKNIFDSWLNLSVDPESYRVRYVSDYSSTITIYQLDSEENAIYGVQLNQAFPISMSPIELGAGLTDQVHNLSVTFSYYDYEVVDAALLDL